MPERADFDAKPACFAAKIGLSSEVGAGGTDGALRWLMVVEDLFRIILQIYCGDGNIPSETVERY